MWKVPLHVKMIKIFSDFEGERRMDYLAYLFWFNEATVKYGLLGSAYPTGLFRKDYIS